jgi:hypothetical protein
MTILGACSGDPETRNPTMVTNTVWGHENGKLRPVETIPGMGGGRIKENDRGMNSTMFCCKNFGKCFNYSHSNNNF